MVEMEESVEMQKLNEIEILESMYTTDLTLDEPSYIPDLHRIITAQQSSTSPHQPRYEKNIRFSLSLLSSENKHLEATFDLPSTYPTDPPDVSIRCNSIESRSQFSKLSADLTQHLNHHIPRGQPAVLEVVQWLLENIDEYIRVSILAPKQALEATEVLKEPFARYWIYSHHIFNINKRRCIVDTARDLDLCGFSVPGKPGLVCVEGCRSACEEFWSTIKVLTWKKITLRHTETESVSSSSPSSIHPPQHKPTPTSSQPTPLNDWRKFHKFEEMSFATAGCRHGNNNMALFQQFLSSMHLHGIFHIFFGIEDNK